MKLLTLSLAFALSFFAADPFAGTWTLQLRRSKYPAGNLPKAMTIRMEPIGDGVKYLSETTLPTGKLTVSEYQANYDGRPVVVRTDSGLTTPVALTRVDANTVTATYTRYKDTVATSKRTVSKDGKTLTIVTASKDKAGKMVTNVAVFERSAP